jgi:DNA invertase Pin-like site-specific DNA recombinase
MNQPTDEAGARNDPDRPTLAFIYDRHATHTTLMLDERIARVKAYAMAQGWQFGGWFVDTDADALSDTTRPALDSLCNTMAAAGGERICLIHDWDRLSRDTKARAALQRRIRSAGGSTHTAQGESDTDPLTRGTLAALKRGQL